MLQPQERLRFEQQVLPHLNAAVNLARWLLRNPADAEDVVQEAMLRAIGSLGIFAGRMGAHGCCRLCVTVATHGWRSDDRRNWLLNLTRKSISSRLLTLKVWLSRRTNVSG